MRRTAMLLALLLGLAALGGTALASGEVQWASASVEAGRDSGEGPDVAITGADLEKASAAALAHTGEGRVTDTEVGDEESFYEVEVTLDSGREIDVQLDETFAVVGTD